MNKSGTQFTQMRESDLIRFRHGALSVAEDTVGIIKMVLSAGGPEPKMQQYRPKNGFQLLTCPSRRGDLHDKSFMALD